MGSFCRYGLLSGSPGLVGRRRVRIEGGPCHQLINEMRWMDWLSARLIKSFRLSASAEVPGQSRVRTHVGGRSLLWPRLPPTVVARLPFFPPLALAGSGLGLHRLRGGTRKVTHCSSSSSSQISSLKPVGPLFIPSECQGKGEVQAARFLDHQSFQFNLFFFMSRDWKCILPKCLPIRAVLMPRGLEKKATCQRGSLVAQLAGQGRVPPLSCLV